MTNVPYGKSVNCSGRLAEARDRRIGDRTAAFKAPFGAVLRAQDAPRVSMANNCLLAMTRLTSPNRLNSCASFLARPL
jgi:hypothetical protein